MATSQHQSALLLHKKGEYEKAFAIWEAEAKEQNAQAMVNIGLMYLRGEGVKKDAAEAKRWFEKAAEFENPSALYNLGLMYDNDIAAQKDEQKAQEYLHKAAQLGHDGANFKLALQNLKDKTDKETLKKGFEHMIQAANLGHMMAKIQLSGYVDNQKNHEPCTNEEFLAKPHNEQLLYVEYVLDDYIRPILHKDGGNIVLVDIVEPEKGVLEVRLCYSGNCEGCSFGATTTFAMIKDALHKKVDGALRVYII